MFIALKMNLFQQWQFVESYPRLRGTWHPKVIAEQGWHIDRPTDQIEEIIQGLRITQAEVTYVDTDEL